MDIKRKFHQAKASSDGLGPRQVRVVISTEATDRAGDVVIQEGIDTSNFDKNPIVLWNHDQAFPVGRCLQLESGAGETVALVEFFEEGIDETADRVCRLVKSGSVSGASIGFNPTEVLPLKSGGFEFTKSELLEFSFCSIPAQADALVVQRAAASMPYGPVIRVTGPMTEEQRKRLSAMWTAYKSGAAPLTLEPGWKLVTRTLDGGDAPAKPVLKSLYDVAWMANILADLGYLQSNVAWEAAYEEDGSQVPAQIAAAMNQLGAAMLALTSEEVAELLARAGGGEDPADDTVDKAAAVVRLKGFDAIIKAGRALSAAGTADLAAAVARIAGGSAAPDGAPPPADDEAVAKAVRERLAKAHELAAAF